MAYGEYDQFNLGIRSQYFEAHTSPTEDAIKGIVEVTKLLGGEQLIDVMVGNEDDEELELTIKIPNTVDVERGDEIWLTVQEEQIHGFDPNTGERITESEPKSEPTVEQTSAEQQEIEYTSG